MENGEKYAIGKRTEQVSIHNKEDGSGDQQFKAKCKQDDFDQGGANLTDIVLVDVIFEKKLALKRLAALKEKAKKAGKSHHPQTANLKQNHDDGLAHSGKDCCSIHDNQPSHADR